MRRTAVVLGAMLALAVGSVVPARAASDPPPTPMTTAQAWDGRTLAVGAVAISPGRVTWGDDSVKSGAVWTRVLTRTATGFTAGPVHRLGTGNPNMITTSGTRTAWIAGGSAVVRSAYSTKTFPGRFMRLQLSGLRLLAYGTDEVALYDLRTGVKTQVSTAYDTAVGRAGAPSAPPAALWGDALAYTKKDGSVWLRNLATGTTSELAASMPSYAFGSVFLATGRVGWTRWSLAASGDHYDAESRLVDLETGATTWSSIGPATHLWLWGMNSDGWITFDASQAMPLTLTPWDGSPAFVVPDPVTFGILGTYVDGPYIAQANVARPTNTPATRPRPTVQLLPHAVAVRPQSLGNVVAPPTLASGRTWQVIDVVSVVPHTCAVDIRNAKGALVRTLGCAAVWQQGEIRAVWDGRATAGVAAPAGIYRWTVRGGNPAGSLLNSDGSTKPITGLVTVN